MPRCDHCKREFEDKNLTPNVVMCGDSQNEIRLFPERSFVLFDGMVCNSCEDAIVVGIRTWCAAPQPDQPTPVSPPTPKQAYVMDPKGTGLFMFVLGALLSLLLAAAGVAGTLFVVRGH